MKQLATLLILLLLAVPSHASPPRLCRTTTASRINHVRVVTASHGVHHHAAQPHFVVTAFAVPVAVPVAPFAPYWYGVGDYYHAPSVRGSVWERTGPEAPPRRTAHEAEPRSLGAPGFRSGASEAERSLVAIRCASCHGRTSPKQGLSLVDPLSLSAADRLRAARAVVNGEMPPENEEPLTEAERAALLRELIAETVASDQNQNDQ